MFPLALVSLARITFSGPPGGGLKTIGWLGVDLPWVTTLFALLETVSGLIDKLGAISGGRGVLGGT
jgi:hypothetical protein